MFRSIPLPALLVLASGFLILFIGGGARLAIGLTLRPMVEDLAWGRDEVGLAVGVFQVVSAVCTFYAGRLADRMSLRLVLGFGLVVAAAGIGLMAFVQAPWQALALYGLVFAIGNGAASTAPVGVMVTRAFPQRAGLANSLALAGMSVGQLVIVAALAAILLNVGWRSVFLWLGLAHLALLPLILASAPGRSAETARRAAAPAQDGLTLREAARTRQFWMLLGIYAVCGLDDFFVATHVVAFAQDNGVDPFLAGNLFALMGLTGLAGVVWSGFASDRYGPVLPTLVAFSLRLAVFALVLVDQSTVAVALFALTFGFTFLVTAPVTVLFIRESFGTRHLGAIGGLVTMVHHGFGGLGAWLGARVYDSGGAYGPAFLTMFAATLAGVGLTLAYKAAPASPRNRS
jgi:predicted MFS family arabinose efflux permease